MVLPLVLSVLRSRRRDERNEGSAILPATSPGLCSNPIASRFVTTVGGGPMVSARNAGTEQGATPNPKNTDSGTKDLDLTLVFQKYDPPIPCSKLQELRIVRHDVVHN